MEYNKDAIKETIRNPDIIYESTDSRPPNDYRVVYSKQVTSATYSSTTPYTKVVASVCGGIGSIVTAYPSKNGRVSEGSEVIYRATNEF